MTARPTLLLAESVLTGDPGDDSVDALLVQEGLVVATGRRAELRAGTPDAEVVDLAGTTLVPGLVESHVHPMYTAMTTAWADCRSPGCRTVADVVQALRDQPAASSGWIRGWGYDDTMLAESRHPTRDDLDQVSTDRPVVVSHISAHFAVCNTRALEMVGVDEQTDDRLFPRGADGRRSGLAWEVEAITRVFAAVPGPERSELRAALRATLDRAIAGGITTLHDLGIGLAADAAELELLEELDANGELPLHVVGFLRGDRLLTAEPGEFTFPASPDPGRRFRLAGAKFWADGSIQGITAALRVPYHCRPDTCGELLQDADELARMCATAAAAGAQLAVHANGDAAVEATVAALTPLQRDRDPALGPHRIEHCQVSTRADLAAVRAAGLGVTFFANHLYYWGDRHRDLFLGPERAADIDPLAWADELGQPFGLHSDCPITPMDPLRTMWSATSRRTRDGHVLGPHQRISVLRALQAMTSDSHRLVGDHTRAGVLRRGMRADVVAVDRDVATLGPEGLRDAGVSAVMVDGQWAIAP